MSFNRSWKNQFKASANAQAQQQSWAEKELEKEAAKKLRQKKAKVSAKEKVEEFFFNLTLSMDSAKEAYETLEEEINNSKDGSKNELLLTEVLDYMTDFQIELEKIKENGQAVIELMGIKEKIAKEYKDPRKCDFLYLKDGSIEKVRPLGVPKKIFRCWHKDQNMRWRNAVVDDPARFSNVSKNDIRQSARYAINVLHYKKDVFGTIIEFKLKILELPQTLYDEMRRISNTLLNDLNAFSTTNGVMFEVSRLGQGMNTRYIVNSSKKHILEEKEKKIIIEKIYDLHKELPSAIDDNDLKNQLGII